MNAKFLKKYVDLYFHTNFLFISDGELIKQYRGEKWTLQV